MNSFHPHRYPFDLREQLFRTCLGAQRCGVTPRQLFDIILFCFFRSDESPADPRVLIYDRRHQAQSGTPEDTARRVWHIIAWVLSRDQIPLEYWIDGFSNALRDQAYATAADTVREMRRRMDELV